MYLYTPSASADPPCRVLGERMFDRPRSWLTADSVRPLRVTEPPPPWLPASNLPTSNQLRTIISGLLTAASSNAASVSPT